MPEFEKLKGQIRKQKNMPESLFSSHLYPTVDKGSMENKTNTHKTDNSSRLTIGTGYTVLSQGNVCVGGAAADTLPDTTEGRPLGNQIQIQIYSSYLLLYRGHGE